MGYFSQKITIELFGDVNFYFGLGLEIVTSIILGGLVGLDREKKHKSAGMKTHILICLGAMMYTAMSIGNSQLASNADPNRMAAQIVSGIGFLGAGAIMQSPKGIFGLTTAATIWVVAAIGVAVGSGYYLSAIFFTLTILIVLKLIDPLYRMMSKAGYYHLEIVVTGDDLPELPQLMDEKNFTIMRRETYRDEVKDKYILHYYLKVTAKDLHILVYQLKEIETIKRVDYRELKEQPEVHDH
jgi:putative Mg2+ transporter-C (MgtC) family protein